MVKMRYIGVSASGYVKFGKDGTGIDVIRGQVYDIPKVHLNCLLENKEWELVNDISVKKKVKDDKVKELFKEDKVKEIIVLE